MSLVISHCIPVINISECSLCIYNLLISGNSVPLTDPLPLDLLSRKSESVIYRKGVTFQGKWKNNNRITLFRTGEGVRDCSWVCQRWTHRILEVSKRNWPMEKVHDITPDSRADSMCGSRRLREIIGKTFKETIGKLLNSLAFPKHSIIQKSVPHHHFCSKTKCLL